jgi:tRNA pseudouridine55 synthase
MDGLLIIDKPAGITSHDVVNRVRRILGTRRVGHTGTLDPFATGVMVVLVGRATRLAQFIDKDEKEYEATIRFGFETDTGDATGSPKSKVESPKSVTVADIETVFPGFTGDIEQVPPMYSAKKIGGKKLYESARKGVTVKREPQRVTISVLDVIDDSRLSTPDSRLAIRVVCSAGTYIRTLAEEIGHAIGVGAHLTDLRRTRSGKFDIAQAITLDQLVEMDDPASALLPMDLAVEHLHSYIVPPERVDRTRQGLSSRVKDMACADRESLRMMSPDGELIAIGTYLADEGSIKPKLVLV